MAPQPYPALKHARTLASTSSASSPSSDAVINIVFGLCAVAIGIFTVWQSRKSWRTWRGDHRRASQQGGDPPSTDIDLEPDPFRLPSSEQAEHVSVYNPSGIAQDFDNTSSSGMVDGLTGLPPSASSITQATPLDTMMSGSTSNEEASLPADPPLGCRPVLEDHSNGRFEVDVLHRQSPECKIVT